MSMELKVAMAMVIVEAAVAMAVEGDVVVAAEVAMCRRCHRALPSAPDAIRRNRKLDLPPRSMRSIRRPNSFPKSYWSHRHTVVATRCQA